MSGARRPAAPTAAELAGGGEPAGWRALAWGAYERLPRLADGALRLAIRATLPITNRHVPLQVLRGPAADGAPVTVLLAGRSQLATDLARRVFVDDPVATPLGDVPIWRLGRELLRRRAGVDLVLARLDRISAALALDAAYVAVPEWVGACAAVPEDPWAFCAGRKSLQSNMTRVRRAGFQSLVSHEPRDFVEFYERMYVPFLRRRHGSAAMVSNRPRLRRCFRQGAIVWALRDGERVAGALVRVRGATLDLVVIGTAGGELGPLHDGAVFAVDLFVLEHARAVGCTRIDFGGSRPSPLDGLLLYKARWDADVVDSRTTFYDVHLWWNRLGRPIRDLLTGTPLLVRQADGLAALWACETPAAALGDARAVLRSVRRLYLIGGATRSATVPIAIPTVHVDPAVEPDWRPGWTP